MKLQLDTIQKSIIIEEAVNLEELFTALNKMFPNEEWRQFSIESKIIQNWTNPIVIEKQYPIQSPWYAPVIYYEDTNTSYGNTEIIAGMSLVDDKIFNLEIK